MREVQTHRETDDTGETERDRESQREIQRETETETEKRTCDVELNCGDRLTREVRSSEYASVKPRITSI